MTQKIIISRPIIKREPRSIPAKPIQYPVPPATLPRPDIDSHIQNKINALERETGRLTNLIERLEQRPATDPDMKNRYDALVINHQELENELADLKARIPRTPTILSLATIPKVEEKFTCPLCGAEFPTLHGLEVHMGRMHGDMSLAEMKTSFTAIRKINSGRNGRKTDVGNWKEKRKRKGSRTRADNQWTEWTQWITPIYRTY